MVMVIVRCRGERRWWRGEKRCNHDQYFYIHHLSCHFLHHQTPTMQQTNLNKGKVLKDKRKKAAKRKGQWGAEAKKVVCCATLMQANVRTRAPKSPFLSTFLFSPPPLFPFPFPFVLPNIAIKHLNYFRRFTYLTLRIGCDCFTVLLIPGVFTGVVTWPALAGRTAAMFVDLLCLGW